MVITTSVFEVYYVKGLGLPPLTLITSVWGRYSYYPHFVDKETNGMTDLSPNTPYTHTNMLHGIWNFVSLLTILPIRDSFGFLISHCELFKKLFSTLHLREHSWRPRGGGEAGSLGTGSTISSGSPNPHSTWLLRKTEVRTQEGSMEGKGSRKEGKGHCFPSSSSPLCPSITRARSASYCS